MVLASHLIKVQSFVVCGWGHFHIVINFSNHKGFRIKKAGSFEDSKFMFFSDTKMFSLKNIQSNISLFETPFERKKLYCHHEQKY